MNEPRNNSLISTIIFLCIAALVIFGLVLLTEEPVPAAPTGNISATAKTI